MTDPAPFLRLCRALLGNAVSNLRVRFSRSLLALIGIGMGTAAVIAILHIGHNARAEAMRDFQKIGADFVMIVPPGGGPGTPVKPEDVTDLVAAHAGLRQAAPLIVGTGMIIEGREQIQSTVVGTAEGLSSLLRLELEQGRFISDFDGRMPFAVIGADLAARLATSRHHSVVPGDLVRVDGHLVTVIGVLRFQPLNPIIGLDLNQSVLVPLQAAIRYNPYPTIDHIVARMMPGAVESDVVAAITTFFGGRLRGPPVQVQVATMLIANIDEQVSIYGRLLLAIGAVSLSMAGIGIMNVMLMSVMERQEEIGLRAAIGASPRAILSMFLAESVFLSAAGAAGGVVLGIAAGWFFVWRSGWSFEFAPSSLPLGGGMALIVGLLFGLYPAWRAASLQPIAALRRG